MRQAMLVAATFVMMACARQPVNTGSSGSGGGSLVGAGSSKAAVDQFMAAVKQADLQAMSTIWGNAKGPGRDQFKRDELEKRLVIMQCRMQHDRYVFLDETPSLKAGGAQVWPMRLTRKRVNANVSITTVRGPNGRWFLENAEPLPDFCT